MTIRLVSGIEVPRHEADQPLDGQRREPDRADGDDVAEGEHDRRQHDRHQQRRLDQAFRRQIGAHHQEGEHGAERHRDRGHAGGERERVEKGAREVGLTENELVGGEAQPRDGCRKTARRGNSDRRRSRPAAAPALPGQRPSARGARSWQRLRCLIRHPEVRASSRASKDGRPRTVQTRRQVARSGPSPFEAPRPKRPGSTSG